MSVYIDSNSRLHHDQEATLALTCPHCEVLAHITPVAVPRFDDLTGRRPRHIGIVFRCDACNSPIFLRFAAKMYGAQRIELSAQFHEVERPREKFNFTYLPEDVERYFKEALVCYSSGVLNAFSSMCRRTAQAAFADLGETGKLRLFDQLNDVREMADIDLDTFALVKRVIFGTDADPKPNPPEVDGHQASIVLEAMKDLLYQAYVRKGRLQQAMTVRRFFIEEGDGARNNALLHRASGED